jgi:hypothetical protein
VKKILRHIYAINCLRKRKRAEHFLNFFAHALQKPWQKPSFSLMILSEEEGTGKSMIIDAMLDIVGEQYSWSVSNLKTVFGEFNEIMDKNILLSFEESDIRSNIRYTPQIRDLHTNPRALINKKRQSHLKQRNFTRMIFIGNAEILAYVSRTDRRHTVFRSSAEKMGNVKYFKELADLLANGGKEALMYYLLHKDISEFNPFEPMWTEELEEQKESSVDKSVYSVLLEWLEDGTLPYEEEKYGRYIVVQDKMHFCVNQMLKRDRSPELSMKSLGRKLRKIFPGLTKSQNMKIIPNGLTKQMYAWDFPDLKTCRELYARYMKIPNKRWEDPDQKEWNKMGVELNRWYKGF